MKRKKRSLHWKHFSAKK